MFPFLTSLTSPQSTCTFPVQRTRPIKIFRLCTEEGRGALPILFTDYRAVATAARCLRTHSTWPSPSAGLIYIVRGSSARHIRTPGNRHSRLSRRGTLSHQMSTDAPHCPPPSTGLINIVRESYLNILRTSCRIRCPVQAKYVVPNVSEHTEDTAHSQPGLSPRTILTPRDTVTQFDASENIEDTNS